MKVTPAITIDESELHEQFVRASGPGGQNINKVSTAVQLRFNVYASPSLPWGVRARLITLAGNRINSAGELIVNAQRHRTQARNRADARERLAALIVSASHKPKARRKTKPSLAAKRRRMDTKQRRSKIKQARTKQLSDA